MKITGKITHHWQLDGYKLSVDVAMQLFGLSKKFPRDEVYSLTDQMRRSSRSVSGHIAAGWRRRRYEAAFCDKLNGAEGEGRELHRTYDRNLGKLVKLQDNPEPWLLLRGNRPD